MTDIAIRCENLGKRYRIGQRESYKALRDVLTDAASAPFRRLRKSRNSQSEIDNSEFWALKDVSFDVRHGEVVGIIGRNGAGKSTLLKILSRITKPTEGKVEIHGRVGSLLEVGTGFHPELTGRENIFLNGTILGMKKREIERKFDEIVAFAEIEKFLDTPVKRYSSGMYVRLAFAVAAHLEPEILVVDEVLAVGDASFQKKCLGKMGEIAKQGRTVMFVSHNMGAVSHLCSSGVVLDEGENIFAGGAAESINFYHHRILSRGEGESTLPNSVIYNSPENAEKYKIAITKVEILDDDGSPKNLISTWDTITIRIYYSAKGLVERGAVFLEFSPVNGAPLIFLESELDGGVSLAFNQGEQSISCRIERLPFAAGDYTIGAGLVVPNIEVLWRERELGILTVLPKNVYGTGVAPSVSRSQLAVKHHWQFNPQDYAEQNSSRPSCPVE